MPCYAPVFPPTHWFICAFRNAILGLMLAMVIIGSFGLIFLSEKGRCWVARMRFRIKHCQKGNNNPRLVLFD